jgi:photosystem II stability/assembly factor-like uncharacterized protein
MDEPRDDIDTWLEERVTPLQPHPGAFEQIRKRAHRRKLGRAALAAAGAVVVVAGAITVPRLILNGPIGSAPTALSGSTTPAQHSSPGAGQPQATGTPRPDHTAATATPTALPPVPPNFAVSSVTFVSTATGWVLGQAGTPGHCGPPSPDICTSVAATNDGGTTWHGVPAPVTGPPDGNAGVSQIRSLDGVSGWAFGPQLYATHDGGQSWTRIPTHGMRVTGLETVNGLAYAVWARCTGTGAYFAAGCTSFSLYSSAAGGDSWAPVPGMTGLTTSPVPGQPGQSSSAQLVLTGTRGYLLAPDGHVYSGPVAAGAAWQPAVANGTPVLGCGTPGPAQADGLPGDTMLAATGTGLVELCLTQSPGRKFLAYSSDDGRTWMPAGYAPGTGQATSLSGTPTGQVLVATSSGIDVSSTVAGLGGPYGLRWRTSVQGASVPGGFSYVGMTTAQQGVAIPADTGLHAVWFTYDGGRHWVESAVH